MRYFKSTTTSENNRTQKYENLDEDKINELRQSEYLNCSFFSYLFFSWVTGIVNVKCICEQISFYDPTII